MSGHEEDAKAVLTKLALDNGVEMPAGQLKKPTSSTEAVSLLDLFRGSVIRKRTVILFIAWFCNCMLYYALSMSAGDLGDNRYLSFSLSGLVEIPSIVIGYFLISRLSVSLSANKCNYIPWFFNLIFFHFYRFGRRLPHGTFLAGGGVACLSVTVLQWLGVYMTTIMYIILMCVRGVFFVWLVYNYIGSVHNFEIFSQP